MNSKWIKDITKAYEKVTFCEVRQFARAWCIVILLVSTLKYFTGHSAGKYTVGLSLALALLITGVFIPAILKPVLFVFKNAWNGFVWCTTRLVLIIFYYLIMTPLGLVMKLQGKDLLDSKIDKNAATYWKKREHIVATKESLEKQF
ncbi:MAG: hypothetical protein HQL28_04995 [Candidatus Omnitrophica bacterium]|nr:hypothetical protein [Candidatus Omnitrophota bacterium]